MPLELKLHSNGVWYVYGTVTVWQHGQPNSIEVRRSTRSRDEAQADSIKRQIENEVAERNHTGREPALSFRQAAARYVNQGGEQRYLEKLRHHFGDIRIDQITQQYLDDAAHKAYPNASSSTRRRQFYAPAIAVLRSAGIEKSFKRPEDSAKRTIFFHPKDADAVIKQLSASRWPNPWTPALFTFLFCQGSRVGETLALDGKRDISLEHRYAIFRDTKSGRERMVPLYARTLAALSTIPNLGTRGPLFLRYDGRPYAPREIRGFRFLAWKSAVERVGLSAVEYTPHTCRHSWATWFYSQTKDVVRLKAEGGWESSEWERYVKLAAPSLASAAMQYGFDFSQNDVQNQPFMIEKTA